MIRWWILSKRAEVRDAILLLLSDSPRDYGIERTRWRLQDLLPVVQQEPGLAVGSTSSLHAWLQKLDIRYRNGWVHKVSPDPHEELKLSVIDNALQLADEKPDEVVVLWLDELTAYRLPSTAPSWSDGDGRPEKVTHTAGENDSIRIGGVLNTHTGEVTYRMADKFGSQQLRHFYRQIRIAYPNRRIFVIQDC